MNIEKEKVSVKFLKIGMYVCKLDRSWLDTPFPFQGFYIRSHTEIKDLQTFCKYVYIDVVKGKTLSSESKISKPSPLLRKNTKARKYIGRSTPLVVKHDFYPSEHKPIKSEFNGAHNLMLDMTAAVEETSFNLRVGKGLDIKKTKKIASQVVNSVLRNPNTLIWLTQLKNQGRYIYGHSLKSAIFAAVFGRHLGLPEDKLEILVSGVLLSDIGKTKICRKLLNKSEPYTDEEVKTVRGHVELGVELLAKDKHMDHDILTIVETHHERFDGSGYPYGLVGNEIPAYGQIAGIVDTYDAMTSKRPFGKLHTPSQAMETLYKQRNKLFSAKLVDEFIQAIGLYPSGSAVQLSDGSIGLVLSHNKQKRLKPEILLVKDEHGETLEKPKFIDLSKKAMFSKKERPCVTSALGNNEINFDPDQMIAGFNNKPSLKKMLFA
ncbi:HD-GYP domain-containing protein [Marinicella rhabdoformis]|uniref:HD-GYP domain-containing protein n=1 Tax=Marinicella rhabdoformis TaxID=2580566 RepID=UPI0012AEB728|nr:HD-GYP domain-containing protein [Marinicella rhabdoformis]